MKKLILRVDDIGASSKEFEVYSRRLIGNFLFLKYIWPFKSWGPYRELTEDEWQVIVKFLSETGFKMTVGITGSWVGADGRLIPFPKKFPNQAKVIKEGVKKGLFEIANHGLTHCVVGKHLPKLFLPNRKFHREFYEFVDDSKQEEHIKKSQDILETFFGIKVVTFVPPGGVWSKATEKISSRYGLKYLCAQEKLVKTGKKSNGLIYVGDETSYAFHDRDIVLKGVNRFKDHLLEYKSRKISLTSVKEFARQLQ